MPEWLKTLLSKHWLMATMQLLGALVFWLGFVLLESQLGAFLFLVYSFFAAFNISAALNCTKKSPCDACKALKS